MSEPVVTAPDPGLTDLLAAHWTDRWTDEDGDHLDCECGKTFSSPREWSTHLKLVVEQHTNGRIAELEATVARVEDAVSGLPACDKYGPDDVVSCGWKRSVADVRAALEGEQR